MYIFYLNHLDTSFSWYVIKITPWHDSVIDQPWSDGNPIRSALGRRVGRTSVPAIFINGVYIGGCDDGPSSEAPGLIPLAFQGDVSLFQLILQFINRIAFRS